MHVCKLTYGYGESTQPSGHSRYCSGDQHYKRDVTSNCKQRFERLVSIEIARIQLVEGSVCAYLIYVEFNFELKGQDLGLNRSITKYPFKLVFS